MKIIRKILSAVVRFIIFIHDSLSFLNPVKNFILNKVMRADLMKHFFVGTIFSLLLYALNVEPNFIYFASFVLGGMRETYMGITKFRPMSLLDIIYTAAPSILMYFIFA